MKEETKKRIEYLLAPAIERGLNGVVEAIRRLADAVGRLEAEPPRWYEIAGRSIVGGDVLKCVLVVGGRCLPDGASWVEKRISLEKRGFTVRELETP